MFEMIQDYVYEFGDYQVEVIIPNKQYKMVHRKVVQHEKWCRLAYIVSTTNDFQIFSCECGQYEHMGLLCTHILKVYSTQYLRIYSFTNITNTDCIAIFYYHDLNILAN